MKCIPGAMLVAALTLFAAAAAAAAPPPITLSVDLRDVPRKIIHAREVIPVRPGPLTLAYPKWLPSEHAPGPLDQQVGLVITGRGPGQPAGRTIRWTRDPLDLYTYRIVVPAGVTAIEVKTDFITTDSGSKQGGSASDNLAVLSWNTVLLYPYAGPATRVAGVMVTPTLLLPDGWRHASALVPTGAAAAGVGAAAAGPQTFATLSLEQLVDSPVLAGRYFREVAIAPEISPRHYLDMAADAPAQLAISQAHIDELSQLVRQSGRLFLSRHYGSFRFLVALSDQISGRAVDHHQSLDNRRPAAFFTDERLLAAYGNFVPHDLVHSWNGKYRRPAGLATPNFQVPADGGGLWVYEGLTEYLGALLTARAGIWSKEMYLGALAETAAQYSHRPGRQWRDLQDTAVMAMPLWANDDGVYDSWRRDGFDFYGEGALLWLDVDVTIRNRSGGRKSLNDFAAAFYGAGGDTGPKVLPYTFEQLVAALNAVAPNDWAGFLNRRLHSLAPEAPLGGIDHGGYRLVYRDAPNAWTALAGRPDLLYSIAMAVGGGVVSDVLAGGVADRAGFVPGMKIVSVDGQAYTPAALRAAIRNAKDGASPIEFVVQNAGANQALRLDYHGGERYPALERVDGTADRLGEIITPMAD